MNNSLKQISRPKAIDATDRAGNAFDHLDGRKSAELIIALCGPVGSGISYVKETLIAELEARRYKVVSIKVSQLILDKHRELGLAEPTLNAEASSEFNRIWSLQTRGNDLRQRLGEDVGAQLAMEAIALHRAGAHPGEAIPDIVPNRVAYVIDQLKNPKEIALLRAVYKNLFFLVGVLASYKVRKGNLSMTGELAEKLMERDRRESDENGQQLEKTLHQSDFFISNTQGNSSARAEALKRFIGLIHGDNGLTPTPKERGMFAAFTAGLRSACLSRQVGASIMAPDGTLLSTGCNDVPKSGGGLYEPGSNDQRCVFNKGYCRNDSHKDALRRDISGVLVSGGIAKAVADTLAEKIKKKTRVGALIEFSRAVHAEMDAIVTIAREGGTKTSGAVMFTTTYPCHNCARHIVASGIKVVYFIEPYEKSLASDLHEDSITHDPEREPVWGSLEEQSKVAFLQFEGVSPTKYSDFFQATSRKDVQGKAIQQQFDANKVVTEFLDDYKALETRVIRRLHDLAETPSGPTEAA